MASSDLRTLEGLRALFTNPSQPKEKPSKAELRRRKKAQQAKAFQAFKAELHEACEALNNWTTVARVEVIYQVTCTHCSEVHLQPELHLSEKPLVRQRNRRSGNERYCRADPWSLPPSVPTEVKQLPARVHRCLSCLDLSTATYLSDQPDCCLSIKQLELPL